MNIRYFHDTDTLYIEFREAEIAETRDLDQKGNLCGLTLEHASKRADLSGIDYP